MKRLIHLWQWIGPLLLVFFGLTVRPAAGAPLFTNFVTPTPTYTPSGCPVGWNIVPSPYFGNGTSRLNAVAAVARDDIWAVGVANDTAGGSIQTLIVHWNGQQWSRVPSPNPSSTQSELYGVTALAANDVWAVGRYHLIDEQSLVLHWDGSTWSVVPAPSPGYNYLNILQAITAFSPADVWAVGFYRHNSPNALLEHWDGSVWTQGDAASGGAVNWLYGVSGSGPADVWAVGYDVLHYDGTAWNGVIAPNSNTLYGVDALTPNDAWAVGSEVLHWDGFAWSSYPSPAVGTLNAVAMRTATDGWAVGNTSLHWNGTSWTQVPIAFSGTLRGVTALNTADVWAVGDAPLGSGGTYPLIEHYANPCDVTPTNTPTISATATATVTGAPSATYTPTPVNGTATPTATLPPTATGTPPTATSTPLAASATATGTPSTATPTATSCPIQFSDVTDPEVYYYAPVYYLACYGVINGYSDGSFRPFNPTTRGQLSKIVTLGFALPTQTPAPGTYTFSDVPPGSTFFAYIETAAARGLVGGYGCGGSNPQTGAAEPCDPAGRPYYRPGNNVTRGQLTKIVVGAGQQVRGWILLNPATASFIDVPPNSTFYTYIETAVCHGVLGGYSDGTFRPNNNATRGQIAKIVYLAVTQAGACSPPTPTPTRTLTATPGPATPTPTGTPGPPTPTPTPTGTPSPHTCGGGTFWGTAWVSDPNPPQNGNVTVYGLLCSNGQPLSGEQMHTTWHYAGSTDTCDGVTGANGVGSCSRNIGAAPIGTFVRIDVEFVIGATVGASTGFTPRGP
jgi:hypothetical protein